MKKLLKLRFIIPLIFLIVLGVLFGGWHLSAKKPLDVVVVNKTIVMDKIDKDNNITADYRKHMGLYWILRQQRYTKEDGSFYNYRKDYYGPHPNEKGELIPRNLDRLESVPDLIYLSDAYGQAQDALEQKNGLTSEEMAVISSAHLHGATVVGEFNIAPSRPDHPVLSELQSLFGLTFSHWVGRYVPDMADLSDIPQWVLDLHEREYGSQWDYSGSGIIFASREGDLLILRRNIDYTGALFVEIKNAYQKQYGALKVNYYNWFELVTPAYDTKTIANYRMNLTDKGKKQLSKLSELISSAGEFPAILCSNGEGGSAPAYYFTGDFNDYVARERYGDFLFSNTFVRIFTYDRAGDITNFFRNFYQPFMERLLKEASGRSGKRIPFGQKNTEASARMGSEGLEVWNGQAFVPYTIKGFNINGVLPGDQPEEHTRDISVYSYFLESVAGMSGNTVRVYSLMPPEFYRALYQYNIRNPGAPLRFFQSIVPPKNITPGEYLSAAALEELEKSLKSTIDAIHGTGTVSSTLGGGTYILDVSPYLLGYIVEIDTEKSTIARLKQTGSGYTYSGEYISGGSGGPGEHLLARLCDLAFSYQASAYGTIVPVGAKGNPMLLPQSPWTEYHDASP